MKFIIAIVFYCVMRSLFALGLFELSCLTTPHYRGGMRQLYTVKRCTPDENPEVTTFQPDVYFFLAAEEVEWNYAPNRTWEMEKFNNTG